MSEATPLRAIPLHTVEVITSGLDESRITVSIEVAQKPTDTTATDLIDDAFRSVAGALTAVGFSDVDKHMENWLRAKMSEVDPF